MDLEALKQALKTQFLPMLTKDIAAPIPAGNIVEPAMRANKSSDALNQAIAQIRKARPDLKATDEELMHLYAKFHDDIVPFDIQAKQSVLGKATQVLQGALPKTEAQQPFKAAPAPTPTLAPDANDFEKLALPILNKYQIPPSVAFGMRDAEGGKIGANNVYNINATDSNPGGADNYTTPQAGVEAYAKLIAEDPRYKKAYDLRSNPDAMVKAIAEAGYAGDPHDWRKRSIEQARRQGTKGAGEVYKTYDEFVRNTPGYSRYAK